MLLSMQKKADQMNDPQIIEKYYRYFQLISNKYRKKFAREAHWEEWKERYYKIMERFHINYKSYAEEYEEFVTEKLNHEQTYKRSHTPKPQGKRDYYDILGVDRNASEEEIKRNFRVRVMLVHPDYYQYVLSRVINCSGPDAHDKTQELIEAYQTLRNPEKRYIYDLSLHSSV